MKANKSTVFFVAEAGIIAALYFALTYVSNMAGLAYGQIQFRLSELLCILPVFTPAAIPGLTVGCLLSNFLSPLGWIDWVCGTGATLIASVCTYALRNVQVKDIPLPSSLMATLWNGLIIGAEIAVFLPAGTRFTGFWASAAFVALGEFVVSTVGGIILFKALKKYRFPDFLNKLEHQKE